LSARHAAGRRKAPPQQRRAPLPRPQRPTAADVSAALARHSFATLPDRGELVAYASSDVRRDGAYTWHRAKLSEAYALRAIADGHLRLTTPSGQLLDIQYDDHVEHDSGDWTWVGHAAGHPEQQTILTFGPHAAFGTIAQPNGLPLRLTLRNGASWIVENRPAKIAALHNAATIPSVPTSMSRRKRTRGDGRHADGRGAGHGGSRFLHRNGGRGARLFARLRRRPRWHVGSGDAPELPGRCRQHRRTPTAGSTRRCALSTRCRSPTPDSSSNDSTLRS
jgi:hypothetical protein